MEHTTVIKPACFTDQFVSVPSLILIEYLITIALCQTKHSKKFLLDFEVLL